jgi:hypothetical protein
MKQTRSKGKEGRKAIKNRTQAWASNDESDSQLLLKRKADGNLGNEKSYCVNEKTDIGVQPYYRSTLNAKLNNKHTRDVNDCSSDDDTCSSKNHYNEKNRSDENNMANKKSVFSEISHISDKLNNRHNIIHNQSSTGRSITYNTNDDMYSGINISADRNDKLNKTNKIVELDNGLVGKYKRHCH